MKKLIYILIFILMINIAFALDDTIGTGATFNPSNANITYEVINEIVTNNISVGYSCINISNGTYQGDYCYTLNSFYTDNKVLFENASTLNCYIDLKTEVGESLDVIYYWYNETGSLIKTGITTCEQDSLCTLDTIEANEIGSNDGIYCSASYTNSWYNITIEPTEPRYLATIGECDVTNQYPILNISYFDETTLDEINATNSYDLIFDDGTGTIEVSGTFQRNTTNQICIDKDPSITEVTLDMTGEYILSEPEYISRVITRIEPNEIEVSNLNIAQEDLYLVGVDNSSTITFTWRTADYQYINGQMLIYSCDENNDITLIDTVDITSGTAVANLQLLTQAYYFTVIYNGETYIDTSTYSKCHVESTSERTYIIDISAVNLKPVLGLFLVDCGIEKVSNNTVSMAWTSNPYDSSSITGCIVAERILPTGRVEIYRNCTSAKSGSFTRTISDNGNAYFVHGEISQNGKTTSCQNEISFFSESDIVAGFGIDGLFAVALLIIGIILMFSDTGIKILFGTGIGIITVFYLGLLGLPIEAVIGIIVFLAIIGLVGNYVRRK